MKHTTTEEPHTECQSRPQTIHFIIYYPESFFSKSQLFQPYKEFCKLEGQGT